MPLVENIEKRFRKSLEFSTHVDLAVERATSGPALDRLADAVREHQTQVRAIVGIHGNATEPMRWKNLGGSCRGRDHTGSAARRAPGRPT